MVERAFMGEVVGLDVDDLREAPATVVAQLRIERHAGASRAHVRFDWALRMLLPPLAQSGNGRPKVDMAPSALKRIRPEECQQGVNAVATAARQTDTEKYCCFPRDG